MGIFLNEAVVIRLSGVFCAETHDEWQLDKGRDLSEASVFKF
ncbi:transposase [Serinicoccus sp. CNJ-927]|nr:transposase [Serinicoccus sp. CNJ-927]